MASHRLRLQIPKSADLSGDGEAFARRIAVSVIPAMEQTFGPIEREGRRVVWTAHNWQDDGTFVTLAVDPTERNVDLYLNTRGLERPKPPPGWWVWPLIIILLVAALTVGIWRGSILLGAGILVAGFGSWIGFDVARQIATERRRTIDTAWWNTRLEACLLNASIPSGG